MKKFLLAAILSCFVSAAFAQGNLQFNNVYFQKCTINYQNLGSTMQGNTYTITVPAGKVLKLEGARVNTYQNSNGTFSSNSAMLMFEGTIIALDNTASSTGFMSPFPIWLPSGNYTLVLQAFGLTNAYNSVGILSGIMFNVVP